MLSRDARTTGSRAYAALDAFQTAVRTALAHNDCIAQLMLYFVTRYRPRPLKRHRHTRGGGHTYDPSAADKREWLALARPHAPAQPLQGALRCTVVARVQRPQKSKHGYPKVRARCRAPRLCARTPTHPCDSQRRVWAT